MKKADRFQLFASNFSLVEPPMAELDTPYIIVFKDKAELEKAYADNLEQGLSADDMVRVYPRSADLPRIDQNLAQGTAEISTKWVLITEATFFEISPHIFCKADGQFTPYAFNTNRNMLFYESKKYRKLQSFDEEELNFIADEANWNWTSQFADNYSKLRRYVSANFSVILKIAPKTLRWSHFRRYANYPHIQEENAIYFLYCSLFELSRGRTFASQYLNCPMMKYKYPEVILLKRHGLFKSIIFEELLLADKSDVQTSMDCVSDIDYMVISFNNN